ncbi:MAG: response regulator [Melioribacteraceae bacterium]
MVTDNSSKHLAHDLNNIFTRILNSIDLLKRKVPATQEILPLLNSIEAGTYLASEMIEENFSNQQRYKSERRINLNSIISDAVRSFSIQQKGKIEFSLKLDPNLKFIFGKYSDYYRVVLNLVTNSVESIAVKGTISIITSNMNESSSVELIIRDTGSGIPGSNIPLIFDESFTTKKKRTESGIGLSSVKKIVEDNGGEVSFKSTVGEGTEFRILLKSAPAAEVASGDNSKTILIAEDEDILRELLTELLQSYNYTVLASSNGREAAEIMKVRMPDLLIIDRKMPDMDGIEFLHEITELNYKVPVILATGSPLDTSVDENIAADRIINKPYNFEELLALIRDLIG